MKHILIATLLVFASTAFAQDKQIDEIEGLFKEEAAEEERRDRRSAPKAKSSKKEKKAEEVSDLKNLETFDDIAVIQRRYLPKTKRFEFFIGGGTNLNDAFFVGNGLTARFGYHFTEKWSVEAMYSYLQNDNRDVTKELLAKGVNTEGAISTDGYYGIDIKWTPIYGKFAYFNEKIIPFDMYFTVGFGMTEPQLAASSAAFENGNTRFFDVESPWTFKIGTGQVFALTKWMAFRWDLSMHFIQADTTVTETGQPTITDSNLNNNLFLNVGLSFFFPEARYR